MNRQFVGAKFSMEILDPLFLFFQIKYMGGVAQMVERSLSMREVPGSMPGASNLFIFKINYIFDWSHQLDKNMAIGSPASSVGRARDS